MIHGRTSIQRRRNRGYLQGRGGVTAGGADRPDWRLAGGEPRRGDDARPAAGDWTRGRHPVGVGGTRRERPRAAWTGVGAAIPRASDRRRTYGRVTADVDRSRVG